MLQSVNNILRVLEVDTFSTNLRSVSPGPKEPDSAISSTRGFSSIASAISRLRAPFDTYLTTVCDVLFLYNLVFEDPCK